MEVPTIFLRPIFQAYVFENIPRKYGQKYGTNVPPIQDPEMTIDSMEFSTFLSQNIFEWEDILAGYFTKSLGCV